MDLNKVQIIGNCTSEIELKATPNGQNVVNFPVATNRSWKNSTTGEKQEQAEFHNVVLWGKLAEIAGQYLKKGKKVYIEGRLQTRTWEAQDGTKRYKTEIIGENIILLSANDNAGNNSQPSVKTETKKANTPQAKVEEEIDVGDLPF